jgi:hypothetical protein
MLKVRSIVGVAAVLIATPLMALPAWADTCLDTNLSLMGGVNSILLNTASGPSATCSFDGLTFSGMKIQLNSGTGSLGPSPSIAFTTIGNEIGMLLGFNPTPQAPATTVDFLWSFFVSASNLIVDASATLTGSAPAQLDETIESTGNPTPKQTVGEIHLNLNGGLSSQTINLNPPQFEVFATKDQFTGPGGHPTGLFNGFSLVPGPIVGAGLPGLVAACGGLIGFARFRRRRQIA